MSWHGEPRACALSSRFVALVAFAAWPSPTATSTVAYRELEFENNGLRACQRLATGPDYCLDWLRCTDWFKIAAAVTLAR
jgi:hypothetical protein